MRGGPHREEVFNDFLRLQYLRQNWYQVARALGTARSTAWSSLFTASYAQKNPLLRVQTRRVRYLWHHDWSDPPLYCHPLGTGQDRGDPAKRDWKSPWSKPSNPTRGWTQFGTSGEPNLGSTGTQVQVRRTTPKVGRNEPCPCGSGKKYKHCHGR